MKEAREAYSHVRRNQILHAAITSFARNGFHKTTMQDIATEARLSPGALYRYFESKEQIIEVCSSASQEHNDSLFQEARKHESLLEATSTLIDTIFSLLDNPDALKSLPLEIELWAEASRSPKILDMVRAGRDSFLAETQGLIEQAQRRGEVNDQLDPSAVGQILFSCLEGMVVHKVIDPDTDHWAYADVLKAMIGGALWRRDPATTNGG